MDRIKLTKQILVAMVVGFSIGALIHGFDWSENAFVGEFLVGGIFSLGGQIFIKTLKLLVVPLVFVSLVCGASSLAGGNNMGRIGLKTVALYLMTTAIAITLALTVANIINPGLGINMAEGMTFQAKEAPPFTQVVLDIFPSNPVSAMAEGNMLQIIVFALLLGVALTRAGDAGLALKASFDRWNEVIMQLVMMLMLAAPVGVFCREGIGNAEVALASRGLVTSWNLPGPNSPRGLRPLRPTSWSNPHCTNVKMSTQK